jgi:spore germination protein GerM
VTAARATLVAAGTVAAAALGWLLLVGLPHWYGGPMTPTRPPAAARAPAEPGRKIKAQLFYVSDEGTRLTIVERDVPYAESPDDQAREIINAQIAPAVEPLVSAIPSGTTLRNVFITPQHEAFVDLSGDVSSAHPGGTTNELLTIYTIVHALTYNLPAVTAVQVLVDGKEVDTLAGHVDIRRPLAKNPAWLQEPGTPSPDSEHETQKPERGAIPAPAPRTPERGTH